jgi:hypothetical protein
MQGPTEFFSQIVEKEAGSKGWRAKGIMCGSAGKRIYHGDTEGTE